MDELARDALGRAYYHNHFADVLVPAWDDLADHRREFYRVRAERFAMSTQLDDWLEAVRRRIAA
jgi:hypothetical protein